MTEPDIYRYEMLSDNKIKFMKVKFDTTSDMKDIEYSFIDTKVSDK